MSVHWQQLRRGEIDAAAAQPSTVLLLPVGAIEQHGPHLPVDTDTRAALAACERAAERISDVRVLVLPPIWWGLSPYWMSFAGTITLRPQTLAALAEDVCQSVQQIGFQRVVIVNGHAGNAGLLQSVAGSVSTSTFRVAALSYWVLAGDALSEASQRDGGLIGHAGEIETSIGLHLCPDRVELGTLEGVACTPIPLGRRADVAHLAAVYEPPNPSADAPDGVYGDARLARAEKGERVMAAVVDGLVQFIGSFGAPRGPSEQLPGGSRE